MNKRLIILAHPSKKSFNHQIAKVIEENSSSVFVMDLYAEEWKQDFLSFEDIKTDWPQDKVFNKIREKLEWADEYIFVYPVWWTGEPAILKNFLDVNLTAGFAFTYDKSGKQKGLLGDKKARVFTTADSSKWLMIFLHPFMKMVFAKAVLGFCNIRTKSFHVFPAMKNKRGREERIKMLENIVTIINK